MIITLAFGWWLAPAAVTVAAFIWAYFHTSTDRRATDYVGGLVDLFLYGLATIVSLIAWLIWAVLI